MSVKVPKRVADLIGQLTGTGGAAPVSGRRAGHASQGNIRSSGHVFRGCIFQRLPSRRATVCRPTRRDAIA